VRNWPRSRYIKGFLEVARWPGVCFCCLYDTTKCLSEEFRPEKRRSWSTGWIFLRPGCTLHLRITMPVLNLSVFSLLMKLQNKILPAATAPKKWDYLPFTSSDLFAMPQVTTYTQFGWHCPFKMRSMIRISTPPRRHLTRQSSPENPRKPEDARRHRIHRRSAPYVCFYTPGSLPLPPYAPKRSSI
jgi:hypothetical protein